MERLDKKILIRELTARLSYGVKFFVQSEGQVYTAYKMCPENEWVIGYDNKDNIRWYNIEEITPYLRPMSSMTEEEKKDYSKACELDTAILSKQPMNGEPFPALFNSIDWLLEHHFDFRGLIERGLAFMTTEGMYE